MTSRTLSEFYFASGVESGNVDVNRTERDRNRDRGKDRDRLRDQERETHRYRETQR